MHYCVERRKKKKKDNFKVGHFLFLGFTFQLGLIKKEKYFVSNSLAQLLGLPKRTSK